MMPGMGEPGAVCRHARSLIGQAGACLAAMAVSWTPTAVAQDAPHPQAGLREVELIVFRYLDQQGSTAEMPPAPALAATDPAIMQVQPAGPGPSRAAHGPPEAVSLQLGNIAARLQRSGQHELLYHGGWLQPVESRGDAMAGSLPPEAWARGLRGSLAFYQRRFLHAVVDLQLETAGTAESAAVMRQERRIRGSAPHYFDNPRFGVILAVRPLAAEMPATGDDSVMP